MLEMLGILFGSWLAMAGTGVAFYFMVRLLLALTSDKLWSDDNGR